MLTYKFIHQSQIYIGNDDMVVFTVLGSCVSVCLYDEKKRLSAICHYLLPLWNNQGLASPKYGNIAIKTILDEMVKKGCNKKNIVAKVFGGASSNDLSHLSRQYLIGKNNIEIAKDILDKEKIKIISQDVGGFKGRKIWLEPSSGKVKLKYSALLDENL